MLTSLPGKEHSVRPASSTSREKQSSSSSLQLNNDSSQQQQQHPNSHPSDIIETSRYKLLVSLVPKNVFFLLDPNISPFEFIESHAPHTWHDLYTAVVERYKAEGNPLAADLEKAYVCWNGISNSNLKRLELERAQTEFLIFQRLKIVTEKIFLELKDDYEKLINKTYNLELELKQTCLREKKMRRSLLKINAFATKSLDIGGVTPSSCREERTLHTHPSSRLRHEQPSLPTDTSQRKSSYKSIPPIATHPHPSNPALALSMSMASPLGVRASSECSQQTIDPSPAAIATTSNNIALTACNTNSSQIPGETNPRSQQRNGQSGPLKIKIIRPSESSIKSTDVQRLQLKTRNRHANLAEPSSDVMNVSAQTKQARNQKISEVQGEAIIEPVPLHNPPMASDDQIRRSSRQRKPINKDILDGPSLVNYSAVPSSNPAQTGESNPPNEHIPAESFVPVSVPTKRKRLSSSELSFIPAELPLTQKDGAKPLATSFDRNFNSPDQIAGCEANSSVRESDKQEQKKQRMRAKSDDGIAVPKSNSLPVVNRITSSSAQSFLHPGKITAKNSFSKLMSGAKEIDSTDDPNLVAPTQSDCTDKLQGRNNVSKKKTDTEGDNAVLESVPTKAHIRVKNNQEYDGLSWEHVSYGGFFI